MASCGDVTEHKDWQVKFHEHHKLCTRSYIHATTAQHHEHFQVETELSHPPHSLHGLKPRLMASRLLYLNTRFAHFSLGHSRTLWNAYPRLAVTNTMRCPCGSLTDMWSGVCGGASHCSRIGKAFSRNQALRFASTSLQDVLALGCVAPRHCS